MDNRTAKLFSPYEREVGNPARTSIKTREELEQFIALNNGVSQGVFCSVYGLNLAVDKIFIDLDGPLCFSALRKICAYLDAVSEVYFVTFSGAKGFHVWIILKSAPKATSKDLHWATLSLLYDAGLIDQIGGHTSGLPVDSTSIGDVRRLARIPNTMRPPKNKYWCTWLPDTFLDWSPKRLEQWIQAPHEYNDFPKPVHDIFFYQTQDYDMLRDMLKEQLHAQTAVIVAENGSGNKDMLAKWFSPFMAPSIVQSIVYDPEPPHLSRFIAAKALLEVGFSPDILLQKFSECGWADFDPETTAYQIRNINRDRYVDRQWWMKDQKVKPK